MVPTDEIKLKCEICGEYTISPYMDDCSNREITLEEYYEF